ncbi:hypothetical protein CERZMDRAFT_36554 [Cercospora zeae-maydis SCOH1-5]|uniref:PHD-type domain-containing protein n=1 Tax=Cercospora zeae-maydis SCOH1-5 TaxID=717836 RepID=A0A6A6FMC3_9PEZI|nr:hypothetical protein CERZMDRAFT_36554 [Cercospora zeae-maydis SCOH1-5]
MLLNPENRPPSPAQSQQPAFAHEPARPSSSASTQAFAPPTTTTHEAAQALASLSTSPPPTQWSGSSVQDGASLERKRSWERRASAQLPIPGDLTRKPTSPTLEQFHVASRSPEHPRPSAASPQPSNIVLPPIHGFAPSPTTVTESSQRQLHGPPPPASHAQPKGTTPAAMESLPTLPTTSPDGTRSGLEADSHAQKAVTALKYEHGQQHAKSPLRESSIPVPSTEDPIKEDAAAASKKRPAPAKKKGTASTVKKEKAPPGKKRKIETKRADTPSSRTSKPAAGKAASAKGTPINSSPAPSTRSYSADPQDEQDDDDVDDEGRSQDGDLYCICRKPDSGEFMIGCDGTCDDWFHGKCVGVAEKDKNLIDKYICPACTKAGIGRTTWKRICRRSDCRRPAKAGKTKSDSHSSKYCSEECGVLYFREMAAKSRGAGDNASRRGARRKGSLDASDRQDDDLGARGGALAAGEVKALLHASNTVEEFRKLGDGVLSPPATPDADGEKGVPQYTESEARDLARIASEKEHARQRHALLKDRMKFVTMAKQAASRVATEKELKPKEYCGYDPRIEWNEEQFQAWRNSNIGQQAFETEKLVSGPDQNASGMLDEDLSVPDVCDRKKCARHMEWSKLAVDDIRFEMSDNGDRMRSLDREEQEIKERVALRTKSGALNNEGTVEVHVSSAAEHATASEPAAEAGHKPANDEVVPTVEAGDQMDIDVV